MPWVDDTTEDAGIASTCTLAYIHKWKKHTVSKVIPCEMCRLKQTIQLPQLGGEVGKLIRQNIVNRFRYSTDAHDYQKNRFVRSCPDSQTNK